MMLYSRQYQILYYFPIMFLSLEYLNSNEQYRTQFRYKILNGIFIAYLLFICIDRGRPVKFYLNIELVINSIEHVLLGFIICIKIAVYYLLLKRKLILKRNELIWIAIGFNIIGFLNEFFQNWYKHQSLWKLNFDSQKDIVMNIIGTILFIVFYKKINKSIHS